MIRPGPPTAASPPAPALLYGTAWKEDETRRLVELALRCGFRGIDTANQRRHYHEAAVGEAVAAVLSEGALTREQLFVQTKFTFVDGQDHRLPYDPKASIAAQVRQSFDSSLAHLQTPYLDSYLLHGPSRRTGLGPEDWEAWRAMERLAEDGRARAIGVSNVSPAQLEELLALARIAPRFVQNRCYATRGWDAEVRALCAANSIRYQGFSLLTANPQILKSAAVRRAAQRLQRTPAQVVFRFALESKMLPLTGTTDPAHMREDLDAARFSLADAELREIEAA